MRERVIAPQIVGVVRRDDRSPGFAREKQEIGEDLGLLRQPVVHQLDEEIVFAEDLLVLADRPRRRAPVAAGQRSRDLTLQAPGQADQALRVLPQEGLVHARAVVETREIGFGHETDEIPVTRLGRGQDRQVIRVPVARLARRLRFAVAPVRRRDVRLDAQDRPDALLESLVVEGKRPEHVAVIGHGDRRHLELPDAAAQLSQPVGAVEKRILRVEVEMDEVGGHRRPIVREFGRP